MTKRPKELSSGEKSSSRNKNSIGKTEKPRIELGVAAECERWLLAAIDHLGRGKQQDARGLITRAIKKISVNPETACPLTRARILSTDAWLKHVAGDLTEAGRAFDEADLVWNSISLNDHREFRAVFLSNFGNFLFDIGEREHARRRLETALELDLQEDPAGLSLAVALNRLNLARILSGGNNSARAIELAQLGTGRIRGSDRATRQRYESGALTILGNTLLAAGKYSMALQAYRSASVASRETNSTRELATTLNNEGTALYAIGDFESAIAKQQEAIKLLSAFKDQGAVRQALQIELNIAAALHKLERFHEAFESSERVSVELAGLVPAPPAGLLATSLKNAGAALFRLGSMDEAREYYTQALDLATAALGPMHPQVADAAFHIAETWYEGYEFDRAQKFAQNALILLAGRDALDLNWRIFDLLGRVQSASRRETAAAFFGKIAVDLIQQARADVIQLGNHKQEVYATTRSEAFRSLAGVLVNQGRIAEAEDILQRLREDERLTLFSQRQATSTALRRLEFTTKEMTLLAEYKRLTEWRRDLIKRLDDSSASAQADSAAKLSEQLNNCERELRAWLECVDRTLDAKPIRKPSGIHKELVVDALQVPPNHSKSATLIAVPTRSAVFLVLRTDQSIYRCKTPIAEQELNRLVLKFRAALSTPNSSMELLSASARELYQIIIEPVEKALVEFSVNSITFWLGGTLRLIPPAALHDGERFLVELWFSKLYAPNSTRVSARSVRNHVAAFATCASTEELEPLDHAEREIRGIVRENDNEPGAMSGRRFFDEKFTAQTLANAFKDNYSIVHIASHFLLKPGSFRRSGLLLGTGTILQLDELLQHPMTNAHTVVLSACDTATSTVSEDGYSVESLADYFIEHGAQTIIASLWTVADKSTADFMIGFYRQMANQCGRPIAQVLGEVQRTFLSGSASTQSSSELRGISGIASPDQSCSHPYYWSPFVVVDTRA